MIFFYINPFSLIIFYLVWSGFELLGVSSFKCHSQMGTLMPVWKGYDNHHLLIKPQSGNGAGQPLE